MATKHALGAPPDSAPLGSSRVGRHLGQKKSEFWPHRLARSTSTASLRRISLLYLKVTYELREAIDLGWTKKREEVREYVSKLRCVVCRDNAADRVPSALCIFSSLSPLDGVSEPTTRPQRPDDAANRRRPSRGIDLSLHQSGLIADWPSCIQFPNSPPLQGEVGRDIAANLKCLRFCVVLDIILSAALPNGRKPSAAPVMPPIELERGEGAPCSVIEVDRSWLCRGAQADQNFQIFLNSGGSVS